ncbi:MAG: pyrroline-5-carboxylate reductase [Gammaproteobacteria bacterium]
MVNKPVIAFIGSGNIARSLIIGLVRQSYPANRIWATNPSIGKLHQMQKDWGLHITTDNIEAATNADILVLTVKPAFIKTVCHELSEVVQQRKNLVISSAAGITTESIHTALGDHSAIVRAMPNIPVQVGAGITGLYANLQVSDEQKSFAESLFRAVGVTQWVPHERDLDAITAISGSGPAYIYYFMEALEKAALQQGLHPEVAHLATIQTVLGAAKLALESDEMFAALRDKITSPQGTTEAAINIMQQADIMQVIMDAVQAARSRAEALSTSE